MSMYTCVAMYDQASKNETKWAQTTPNHEMVCIMGYLI